MTLPSLIGTGRSLGRPTPSSTTASSSLLLSAGPATLLRPPRFHLAQRLTCPASTNKMAELSLLSSIFLLTGRAITKWKKCWLASRTRWLLTRTLVNLLMEICTEQVLSIKIILIITYSRKMLPLSGGILLPLIVSWWKVAEQHHSFTHSTKLLLLNIYL